MSRWHSPPVMQECAGQNIGMSHLTMNKIGRRGLVALGLVVIATASLGLSRRILTRNLPRFPYETKPLPAPEYAALAAKPGWRASQISVAPDISLNGLIRRPKAADSPWVLFFQGNDSDMLSTGQAFLSALAADRDWGLAIYAYRGYDSSGGEPRLTDLAADAPQVITQLCSLEAIDRSRVHIIGFSIGGHLAVRAMAVAAQTEPRPASLTLLAAVNDIVMVPRSLFSRLDPGDHFQTQPYLSAIPAPVLVIQGTADEALRGAGQGRAIAAALGERSRYIELPGVMHKALLSNETALATIRGFISEHTGSVSAPQETTNAATK